MTGRFISRTRFTALGGVFAAAFVAVVLAVSPAAAVESFTFMGLPWGASPEQARAHLSERGFEFQRSEVTGPRREFHMNRALGVYMEYDRGKRLIAHGRMGGQQVSVELVFGANEQLDHVILQSEKWNGTLAHAREIVGLARILTEQYEERYGHSDRSEIHGYIDTAIWRPADDGSRLNLYIRGTNGYMFYPNDETMLRVHFANPRYKTGNEPVTTIVDLRTYSTGTTNVQQAEQPAELTEEEMKERLRQMYPNDGMQ